jgi:hypothetical protein
MGSFAIRLAETAATWSRAVSPIAEWVARTLSLGIKKQVRTGLPATRLTQSSRREARGNSFESETEHPPLLPRICRTCGEPLKRGQAHCATCAIPVSRERFVDVARQGREASHTREAEARRAETQSRQAAARLNWRASDEPAWLDEKSYRERIQPRLAEITVPIISSALGVSKPYATDIRTGRRCPHPRHWLTLAKLVSVSPEQ